MRFLPASGSDPGKMPTDLCRYLVAGGHLPAETRLRPLTGGRTNRLWHAPAPMGDIVIKVYATGFQNPLFANDPAAEAQILRHLDGSGLAPKLHAALATPHGRVTIYGMVRGHVWRRNVAAVARTLAKLHKIDAPRGLSRAPDGSEALSRQTRRILDLCLPNDARTIARLRPAGSVPPSGSRALLHGDAVPGNLIDSSDRLTLIDWQCPSVGDPVHDLAIFLSPAMQRIYRGTVLSMQEEADFLTSYQDDTVAARYRSLAPWFHWRMAAYCQWRAALGNADYRAGIALEIDRLHRVQQQT